MFAVNKSRFVHKDANLKSRVHLWMWIHCMSFNWTLCILNNVRREKGELLGIGRALGCRGLTTDITVFWTCTGIYNWQDRCNLGKFTFTGDKVLVPSFQSKLMTALLAQPCWRNGVNCGWCNGLCSQPRNVMLGQRPDSANVTQTIFQPSPTTHTNW